MSRNAKNSRKAPPGRRGQAKGRGPSKSRDGQRGRSEGSGGSGGGQRGRSDGPGSGGGQRGRSGGSGGGQRRRPDGLGGDQVEGRQAVRELLLSGKRPVREVLIADESEGGRSSASSEILDDIETLAQELGVAVHRVTRKRLQSEAKTESNQGVMARAGQLQEADFDALAADPKAFLLVLDGVTDPGNLGAILRTAECAGVTGVVIGRHRAVRVTPTVTKSAAGAIEHVPIAMVAGVPNAISQLNEAGVSTVGLDEAGDYSVFELPPQLCTPVALVLGAEGKGLGQLSRKRVGTLAAIPLVGQLNSLNVSTACAVACFEMVRIRQETVD